MEISIKLQGAVAAISPKSYLGGDNFYKFRNCIAGSKFEPATRSNTLSLAKLPGVVSALQSAGFAVTMDGALTRIVQREIASNVKSVDAAKTRTQETDARLASKGMKLYPFQREGIEWLSTRTGALLADDMGLGKTVQIAVSLPEGVAAIVVCPAVAKGGWQREIAKWRPELKITVLSGRGSFRWPSAGEIVVINYDILPDIAGASAPANIALIADEAHALKSGKTARGSKFLALSKAIQAANGRVWLATATPMLNRPQELWSVLNMGGIASEAFGSWSGFCAAFNGYKGKYGMEWGRPNTETVATALRRVSLRRTKTTVLPDLPVKTWQTIEIETDSKTLKTCDKIVAYLAEKGVDLKKATIDDLAPLFLQMSAARAALAASKIEAMSEIVESYEEQSEPLVVFSAHRAPIDFFIGREGWAVITGDTSPESRTEIENRFQAGELKGVACTIKAGGVAITLTKASNALFVDLEWTPALNSQAEDRVCRIGQTRGVVITTLISNHLLDQRISELLANKRELINSSVEAANVVSTNHAAVPQIDFEALNAPAVVATTPEARKSPRNGRLAQNAAETWAHNALVMLAANDPDRAGSKNDIGFNGTDTTFGHSLAQQVSYGLSDKQWGFAIKICRKYWRQVGECPELGVNDGTPVSRHI